MNKEADMVVQIVPLQAHHRPAWQPLAEGYKAFYRTPTTKLEYDRAWARILAAEHVHGLGVPDARGSLGGGVADGWT